MSPWWWYVLALLGIGAVLSVGGDLAKAISGLGESADDAPAGGAAPSLTVPPPPLPVRVGCPRCNWTGVLVPLATPPRDDKAGS